MTTLALMLTMTLASLARNLTLSEAQQMARNNYPLIKRYDIIGKTEQLNVANISKSWLPQVQFDAQATWQSDVTSWPESMKSMLTQLGADVKGLKKDQYKIGVSVNQQVYDGGTTSARKEVAKAQSQVEEAQNTASLYALRERVDDIYFSILLTDERLKLNEEMQLTLQANEDKLTKMNRQGTATMSDVNTLMAERLQTVQQHTQLETTRKSLLDVLSVFVGEQVDGVVRPLASESFVGDALQRPEMDIYNKQLELVEAQKKTIKSGLKPKVSIFASGFYGYPGYNMFEDMMNHDWSLNGMIGAKLSWNLSNFYTRKNDLAKLQSQSSDIMVQRENFLFNNRLQQTQESTVIAGYKQTIAQDDEIVRLRSKVRKAAEAKLDHGIIDVTALVQEISRENQAAINKSLHEVELLQHQYKLLNVKGE